MTRNSNLYLEDEESRSILDTVDTQLHRRRKGEAVRLEIEAGANQEIIDRLVIEFPAYAVSGISGKRTDQSFAVFHLYEETPRPDLKLKPSLRGKSR